MAGGVDTPDVVVRLDPTREVTGRVVFDGASRRPPTTSIEVALRSVRGSGGTAKVADDGTFTVKDVAPGRYFVEVSGPGNRGPSRRRPRPVWTRSICNSKCRETVTSTI